MRRPQYRVAVFFAMYSNDIDLKNTDGLIRVFFFGNSENKNLGVLAYSPQSSDLQVLGRESSPLEWAEKLDDIQM